MKVPKKIVRQPVVILQNVTKQYQLLHEKPTFSEQVIMRKHSEIYTALANVSIKFYKGEKIGIIGKNGSGKTTLLKIIAGITTPTIGTVETVGRIVSLIDLEAGFHPELTGEENIFLNGLLVGMTKQEIKKKFEKITQFADIGKFIDSPMFTYSQGMKLRLGFSIAIHADPDILILDEGIGVGDADFHEKSNKKIREFFNQGKTIFIVTHWLDYLKKNCSKFVHLEKGKVVNIGNSSVIRAYRSSI